MAMQLELRSFPNAGELEKERLIIRVLEDLDLGAYAVLRSKLNDAGGPTSGSKDAYWFPDVQVKRGDLVVLYTKKGTASKKPLEGKAGTAHFYYWHQSSPFWASTKGNTAVLLHTESWTSKSPFGGQN